MKTQSVLLAALAAAPSVLAHTVWSVLYVDGVSQGDGAAIRMRRDPKVASFPLEDYSSDDMACNVDGTKGVPFVSPVQDGATLTFEMRSWPDDPSKEPLDRGHYGPCAVYLKKVSSAIEDKAAGDGWFKLMDDGYDPSTDQWCTDRLIDNNGRLSVVLPKGLQGGYYLARPEVVAMHNASEGGAQFYTSCAQIFLESTGDLVPESTVAIPGPEYVTAGQSSVKFNIYVGKNAEYRAPGPAVANFTSGMNTAASGDTPTRQTEGVVPASCIAQNANWCGKEVPSYTDEAGCWAAGESCWTQDKACWDAAPATGGKVCDLWSDKCTAINDACSAGDFTGPPNKDKVITPKREKIDIGLVIPVVGGGKLDAPGKISDMPIYTPKSEGVAAPSKTSEAAPEVEASSTGTASAELSSSSVVTLLSFTDGLYVLPTTNVLAITVPASESTTTPAPMPIPDVETKYKVEVVTETQYVTVAVDAHAYRKRRVERWAHHTRH